MESFANLWSAQLQAAAPAAQPYLQLASADMAGLPDLSSGFSARLFCDGEWMTAIGVDAATFRLYVIRGKEGIAAASHPAGATVMLTASAAGLAAMLPGTIVDRAVSYVYDTTPTNPTYLTHNGLSLVIPAGVAVSLEYEAAISVYQNTGGQYASPNIDFRLENSAGTQVAGMASVTSAGGGGTARFRPIMPNASGGIAVLPMRFAADLEPLAAADVISLRSTVSSIASLVVRCGEAGPQTFTARAL